MNAIAEVQRVRRVCVPRESQEELPLDAPDKENRITEESRNECVVLLRALIEAVMENLPDCEGGTCE